MGGSPKDAKVYETTLPSGTLDSTQSAVYQHPLPQQLQLF